MADLRHVIAQAMRDDATLTDLLTGGIYPVGDDDADDQTAITKTGTPDAYDATTGDVLPCAVVSTDNAGPFGPIPLGTLTLVRVWLYQQRGRGTIEAAAQRVAIIFDRERVTVGGRFVTLRYAGLGGSAAKDPALRDASVNWVWLQANHLLALPS